MTRSRRYIVSSVVAAAMSMLMIFPAFAKDRIYTIDEGDLDWKETKKSWNVTDLDGEPIEGWVKKDEDIYFLDKNGNVKTGWIKDDGSWYYLDDVSGILKTECWIDNYWVDEEGQMTKIK